MKSGNDLPLRFPTLSPPGPPTRRLRTEHPMTTIPIYDATAPIVCTAGSDEIPTRIGQLERMRTALVHVERTEHGLLLELPNRHGPRSRRATVRR